jgi:hypothetical protein
MIGYKPIPELNKEVPMLFWSKVAFTGDINECWNWTHTVRENKKPYGRFDIGHRNIFSAHRLAYYLQNKTDPKDLNVLHKCDNPKCCNPNHLFLGTNADNVADKVSKGRQAVNIAWNKGKKSDKKVWENPGCIPNEEDFKEMKRLYELGGVTINELAIMYSTSKRAVSKGIRFLGGFVNKHHSVMTEKDVLEIREKYIPRVYSAERLAKEYGAATSKTIFDIIHRKIWKNI